MAARPNTKRTLEYGVRLAENHAERLDQAIVQAETLLVENLVLTPSEVKVYQASVKAAKKMKALLQRVSAITLPKGDTATPRRGRGRPSRVELKARTKERSSRKRKR